MLTFETLRAAARALDGAYATQAVVPLISDDHADMSLSDGYAIQRLWSDLRTDRGEHLVGYKIGLTSRAMQIALKVDSPQYGRLFDTMTFRNGAQIDTKRFYKPRLEVELAFIMGQDLHGPHADCGDALRATAFVQPALELVDYRTVTPRSVMDMVADNTAAAGAVLGGKAVRPDEIDVRWIGATLARNGTIEESGVSAAVLGHPAIAVATLANLLASEQLHLKAGDIVLAGSFTRQIDAMAGDAICAHFGTLGTIKVSFI